MTTAVKPHLETANTLYRDGKFDEAEQVYRELHRLTPKNTSVLMRLGELALWKNQTAEAERYLKEAEHHASWLDKKFPFNMQLNASLALTYYRQDRFRLAAQHYQKAAGPIALAPFHSLKELGAQLATFNDVTPYLIEGAEMTRVPFALTDPLPLIYVSINGSEPLPFIIDTGGAEVILDRAMIEKVGAIQSGTIQTEGGGTAGNMGLGKIDSITLGDITVRNVPIHIMNTEPFAEIYTGSVPVKGVIGTCLLMHFLPTIDYLNGCLILRRKTADTPTDAAKVLPFWLAQTHYMVTYGTLNGNEPMLFFIDTGLAGKGFSVPEATAREEGIALDWSKADKGVVAFGASETVDVTAKQLTLGTGEHEIVAHNLNGIVFKKPLEVFGHRLGFWIGGLVSHQFFREYALTLDFVQMKLVVSR
jgi:predicted aspartyl protease